MRPAALALFLCACATTGAPPAAAPPPAQEAAPPEPEAAPPPSAAAAPSSPDPGVIPRPELDRVLDGAPGRFLAQVDPEPVFRGRRFYGWRLVRFFPGDPRFAGVDLRPGDVVVRVNGRTFERPEELMELWQSLRRADELVVDAERDGRPRTLRWSIRR